jgi:hypothetical protein
MRLPLRAWDYLFAALGRLRRNRKQRRAAAAKRRDLRRRHELMALEPRVVMDAQAVNDDLGWIEAPHGETTAYYDFTGFDPTANDTVDEGETLSLVSSDVPSGPVDLAVGDHTFEYFIQGSTGDPVMGVVSITVLEGPNEAPVANPGEATLNEDDPSYIGNVSATDAESDPLSYELLTGPTHGDLEFDEETGSFTYIPDPDFNGSDSFTFLADDGFDESEPAEFILNVSSVNDDFTPVPDAETVYLRPNEPYQFWAQEFAPTDDVDGDIGPPSVTADYGYVYQNYDGSYVYNPQGHVGPATVTITYADLDYSHDSLIPIESTNTAPTMVAGLELVIDTLDPTNLDPPGRLVDDILDEYLDELGQPAIAAAIVGDNLVISERFLASFRESKLCGLSNFHPVEISKLVHRHRNLSHDPPKYFKSTIKYSPTTVNQEASGYVWENKSAVCPVCLRGGTVKRYSRVVLDERTWNGDDLFWPRGGPCIISSAEFYQFYVANHFCGLEFGSLDTERKDLYPWENAPTDNK